jgi:hypothetical protein
MFDPEALLERLSTAGVSFVVIGGVAVGFHGVIRGTKDLDICPEPDGVNYERLASVLSALEATNAGDGDLDPSEFPHDPRNPGELAAGGNFQLATSLGALDIMQWVPGIDADHAYPVLAADAVEIEWAGRPLHICSLEHLRLMKRTAGRPQDMQDLRDLELAHGEGPTGL